MRSQGGNGEERSSPRGPRSHTTKGRIVPKARGLHNGKVKPSPEGLRGDKWSQRLVTFIMVKRGRASKARSRPHTAKGHVVPKARGLHTGKVGPNLRGLGSYITKGTHGLEGL